MVADFLDVSPFDQKHGEYRKDMKLSYRFSLFSAFSLFIRAPPGASQKTFFIFLFFYFL
jgi:hypothetical protein